MTVDAPCLVARDLHVQRGAFVLGVQDLSLAPGVCTALLGPNGAGKTTLLSLLGGRLAGGLGEVRLFGIPREEFGFAISRAIGFVPDDLEGFGWMTARQHLDLRRDAFPEWDEGYAARLVHALAIPMDTPLKALSRGNRAKLAFVSAEGYRPPVLLLDEPTTGLDPVVRRALRAALIEALRRDPHRSVLFSTHLIEDVVPIVDRILLMHDGNIVRNVEMSRDLSVTERQAVADSCIEFLEVTVHGASGLC